MKEIFTIPNILTFLRLPLAILVIFNADSNIKFLYLFIAILFDGLDGYIARKLNQTTKLGGIIDPLFDRLFVIILFSFFFISTGLPYIFILFFFLRDLITVPVSVWFLLKKIKVEIKARFLGKLVTAIQFLVLVFMIAQEVTLVTYGMYILFILSIFSLIDYLLYFRKIKHA